MAKKRIKKVFLLGRIFDLDLDDPGNFEQSVCSELKLLLKGQDIPFKAVVNDSTRPKGIDARFSKVKGLTMTINY